MGREWTAGWDGAAAELSLALGMLGCAPAVCINTLNGTGPSALAKMELHKISKAISATATSFIGHSLQVR